MDNPVLTSNDEIQCDKVSLDDSIPATSSDHHISRNSDMTQQQNGDKPAGNILPNGNLNTTANGHQNPEKNCYSKGVSSLKPGAKAEDRLRLNSGSSPGSTSGRSSTSSLNTVGLIRNGINNPINKKESRKVSINEHPNMVTNPCRPSSAREPGLKQAMSTTNINNNSGLPHATNGAGLPNAGNLNSNHRTSLLHISAEKRAKKVRFFINNDKFFKGAVIAVSNEKFRTFGKLLEHLTRIMCNQVTLPNGVRFIFGLDGKNMDEVSHLLHEGNYVCSSNANFKKLDYLKLAQEQDQMQWNRIKRETYYFGSGTNPKNAIANARRDAYRQSGHSKSFGQAKNQVLNDMANFKPRIIAVLRSGLRPRKAVRVLLNHRNAKSFDAILGDLTNLVKLDSGAVRKVLTLEGKAVLSVNDFTESEVFIAYGSDKTQSEDFDLDLLEFKNIQGILKSPELDAKYEKFALNSSPKTARKKFAHQRLPAKSGKMRKTSASRNRVDSPRRGTQNDNYSSSAEKFSLLQITDSYLVGDIIGDGNFAVVRKCFNKKNKTEYALKIIDKSKCLGKEHMIESEIEILNLVSHPNIIDLHEVFDLPDEKYLVTEYVRGGDLFDAIAVDTKYSEVVARGMVRDLTAALKYLHDKMIVHRDIKPENLLVVNYPSQGLKSLKLGDFGLAQLVSEPLFTVCGTPTYVAPEILAETGYGVKVDVWATGVIMYILLVGFPPFSSRTNNQEELFDQILSGLFEFNSPDWDDISYPAKELISWTLQVDPLQRYSAYEILQHPWIKKQVDL